MIYVKINNTEYPAEISGLIPDRAWNDRNSKTITLTMSHDTAVGLFTDGANWSIVQRDTAAKVDELGQVVTDSDGNPVMVEQVQEWDNSEYSVAGTVTDHRDGTVSVKMGKPLEVETLRQASAILIGTQSITVARATELRPVIEMAAVSLPDAEAVKAVELCPAWAYPVGYAVDVRVSDGGKLYKCIQAHTSQEGWNPGATPAMWVVIDETHAGTADDPIPAARGMEYEYGKYYLDPEDSKTYLCERTGEAAGGRVVLQYLPHELTGQYFTAVE